MSTIVVGYDGSAQARAAVRHAVELAQGGRVVVVHAYESPPPRLTSRWRELLAQEQAERAQAVLDAVLLEGNEELAEADWEGRLAAGHPAQAILDVAHEAGADAIVVGSRGYGPASALVGSVSRALLQIADLPVTVIPPAGAAEEVADDAADTSPA
jgi:nucleotide-binding universal stress UspA family protein